MVSYFHAYTLYSNKNLNPQDLQFHPFFLLSFLVSHLFLIFSRRVCSHCLAKPEKQKEVNFLNIPWLKQQLSQHHRGFTSEVSRLISVLHALTLIAKKFKSQVTCLSCYFKPNQPLYTLCQGTTVIKKSQSQKRLLSYTCFKFYNIYTKRVVILPSYR